MSGKACALQMEMLEKWVHDTWVLSYDMVSLNVLATAEQGAPMCEPRPRTERTSCVVSVHASTTAYVCVR
jgi:hypothetical protein